jgi:hypothetical protein
MKKYVKFIGTNHLSGSYADEGLTEGSFYETTGESDSGKFVSVINDYEEVRFYCVEIFE